MLFSSEKYFEQFEIFPRVPTLVLGGFVQRFFKLRLVASGGYPVGLLVCLRHKLLDKVASIGLEVMVLGVVGGCISKKVMLVLKVRI